MRKSTIYPQTLGYMTSEAGPLYTSRHSFLDAWATPYGKAVRARAEFQILTLFDYPSMFSIIIVRSASLMLVGCHNGVMTCALIVDGALWSLTLSLDASTPVNHGRIRSRAYVLVVGGGCRSHFDEPNYSPIPTIIFHLNCMGLTTVRLRDHGVDLAIPSLLRGRTLGGFCLGSTSDARTLNGTAQQITIGGVILYAKWRWTYTDGCPSHPEGVLRFCSPIRVRWWGSWEWHRTIDRADEGRQSRLEGCGQVSWINVHRGSVRPAYLSISATDPRPCKM